MVKYFGTHNGKVFLNAFVSAGAVVVILGALGKILHASWGTAAITAGMLAECIIFLLMIVVPVDDHPHWDRYFPDLYKDPHDEVHSTSELGIQKVNFLPEGGGRPTVSGNPALDNLDAMLQRAEITPKSLKKLSEGFEKFNDTVSQIAQSGAMVVNANDFANKTKEATAALTTLTTSYLKASDEINNNGFTTPLKHFSQEILSVTKNISSINNIYGVEIQETLSEIKQIKGYFSKMNDVANELHSTVGEIQQTKEQISLLINNLSNLNDVYGRVLTAMQGR